ADDQLRRLSGAEADDVLEHRADGGGAAVAAAGPVPGHEPLTDAVTTMLNRLLSHDLPRNRVLALVLLAILLALAFTPFLFPGTKALTVAAKTIVFIVLAAGIHPLLRYTA